jgi:5-methylcytosine-specific restriction endonuclease McrA
MSDTAPAFQRLRDFMTTTMRTQHVYQPVMLKTLLVNGGQSTVHQIAAAFLALDQSQLDYYEVITKRMPGAVLRRHGIVEYDGRQDSFRLTHQVDELTATEREELIALCDSKLAEFMERRGSDLYAHREIALGDLSGTLRYQVLSRAGFRCELCGVPADEQALQVDHIVPRKHGGDDLIENLQALCHGAERGPCGLPGVATAA